MSKISVTIAVKDGEKYIEECLRKIQNQTRPADEIIVYDNNSQDRTPEIVESNFSDVDLVRSDKNYSFGGGHNRAFKRAEGDILVAVSVDVLLEKDFLKKAEEVLERNPKVGALQAKIFQYDFDNGREVKKEGKRVIDTTGFKIFRSRRIINRGHGAVDQGQFDSEEEIFSYEGAVPIFRREALEDAKIFGEYHDEDMFWYGDDVDLGWRLHLLGWKSFYSPKVKACHDRQTTNRLSKGKLDFIKERRKLPKKKRALDYRNIRLTYVKNELPKLVFRDFFYFFKREFLLFLYVLVFEPFVLKEIFNFFRLLPQMLKKRKIIMKRKKTDTEEMQKWFR
jgi:GT2 family glycosyltransferase